MKGTLEVKEIAEGPFRGRWLCVKYVEVAYDEPKRYVIYWGITKVSRQEVEERWYPFGEEVERIDQCLWRDQYGRYYRTISPEAIIIETEPVPKPGRGVWEWRRGHWEKVNLGRRR